MKFFTAILSPVILLLLGLVAQARIIELKTANFEHETQASTGATTGDWFVMFFSPTCSHCKKMTPAWEELGKELDGQINVAKVNGKVEESLRSRFEVSSYPTLLYFHKGTLYQYKGERTVEKLKAFVELVRFEGYTPDGEPISLSDEQNAMLKAGRPVPKAQSPSLGDIFGSLPSEAIMGGGVLTVLTILVALLRPKPAATKKQN